MIPVRKKDVVSESGATKLTLLAEQDVAPTGGAGTIRPYALLERDGVKYQIDAILLNDDTIDWFDIFDPNGVCRNEGDPWFSDPENPDSEIEVGLLASFLDSLED